MRIEQAKCQAAHGMLMRGRVVKAILSATVLAASLLISACATPGEWEDPQERMNRVQAEQEKRRDEAAKLYSRGAGALSEDKLPEAKRYLLQALELNAYHGAAHNDLGVVYFKEGNFYEAASEFDVASRHLLGRYRPFYNLGMVLEEAGQLRQAADAYQNALKIAPEELAVMENLARTYVKLNSNHRETIELLAKSLLREQDPDWQRWLRLQLFRLRGDPEVPPHGEPAELSELGEEYLQTDPQ